MAEGAMKANVMPPNKARNRPPPLRCRLTRRFAAEARWARQAADQAELGVSWDNQKIMLTLSEIEEKINQLAQKIGAPQNILPTYGYSEQTARPHIEVDSVAYYYVIAERGQEISRDATFEIDELLYQIFADVTFELAIKYESAHRIETQDSRRIHFQHQVELLSMLSPIWAEQESREHKEILNRHPFDDDASIRANFSKQLREQGNSAETAWRIACEKYPLPRESER